MDNTEPNESKAIKAQIKINTPEKKAGEEHDGHRERLWGRYINAHESMPDHELVELMLFNIIPRANTNELAHRLLRRFGSIRGILEAKPEEIMSVKGATPNIARFLLLYGEIEKRLQKVKEREYFNTKDLASSLIEKIGKLPYEHIAIITADSKGRVISKLFYSESMISKVKFDLNYFKKTLTKGGAKRLLVAHNHPFGTAEPSEEDIITTRKVKTFAKMCGAELADCLIVTKDKAFSIMNAENLRETLAVSPTQEELENGRLFDYKPLTDEEYAAATANKDPLELTAEYGDDLYEF